MRDYLNFEHRYENVAKLILGIKTKIGDIIIKLTDISNKPKSL